MTVFSNYARYYDLLYRDKDYNSEVGFIDQLIRQYAPKSENLLELGCGTGCHGVVLAQKGYTIHGIDLSETMLSEAETRRAELPEEVAKRLSFSHGNICTARINKTFNAVISIFHVMSYLTTNQELKSAFATARAHLKQGGIFIFDCWYGPAVLTDRPAVRVKRLQDDMIEVTRIAEPVITANENYVDVNYQVIIRDKTTDKIDDIKETHRMRYLFEPEVRAFFADVGMEITEFGEWMTGSLPGFDTWNVYFVGKVV